MIANLSTRLAGRSFAAGASPGRVLQWPRSSRLPWLAPLYLRPPRAPAAAPFRKCRRLRCSSPSRSFRSRRSTTSSSRSSPASCKRHATCSCRPISCIRRTSTRSRSASRKQFAPRVAELVDAAAHFYASHFTEQELRDLLTFYQSPLGQKALTEEPKVLDQSMTYAGSWAENLSDDVIKAMRVEMKKRGHDM